MPFDKVKVRKDKDTWLATTEVPPVYGVGDTQNEALEDYNESLKELKEDLLEASDLKLSESWQLIREIFIGQEKES